MFHFTLFLIFLKIDFREAEEEREKGERDKQTDTDLLFHLFMHSLVDSYRRPDQGSNPGVSGRCSDQLGYLARARLHILNIGSALVKFTQDILC